MKCLHQIPMALAIACVAIWFSCGSSGKDDQGGAEGNGQQTPPGTVGQGGLTEVKGRFVLGEGGKPASGYQIWKIDHTLGEYVRKILDSTGSFSWPLDTFTVDSIYSFYVVGPELQAFGSVDFGPSTAGVQSSVIYSGGLGFDLGELVVALATSGKGDPALSSFAVELAGGFSLEENSTQTFEDLSLKGGLTTLGIGRDFTVFDPLSLPHGVYLHGENSPLTAEAMREASRLRFIATYNPDQIANIFVAEAGSWLSGARLASYSGGSRASAVLWSLSSNTLPEVSAGKRAAYVFPPEALPAQTIVLFSVWNATGEVQSVPALLAPSYTVPPLLTGISLDAGAITVIDYSTEEPNGVTVPFCIGTSDISFQVTPPKDSTGIPITGESHPYIDVEIEHYSAEGLLTVSAFDYDAPLNELYTYDIPGSYHLTWNPVEGKIRYTLADDVYDLAVHDLDFWLELLLEKVGDQNVNKIRLKIVFSHVNGRDQSGVPVWLKRNC